MMSLEQMEDFIVDFVERFEAGEVDAAEFVDNANETIEVFKELINRMKYEETLR